MLILLRILCKEFLTFCNYIILRFLLFLLLSQRDLINYSCLKLFLEVFEDGKVLPDRF